MKRMLVTLLILVSSVAPLAAQQRTEPAAVPPVPVVPIGSRVGELPTGYEDGGRRDPFSSLVLVRRPVAPAPQGLGRPRNGLAGVTVADVTVRGIVKSGKTMMAILETPNKQSYVARANDRLADAAVHSIDAEGVVFADGTSTTNRIRKVLRTAGEDF